MRNFLSAARDAFKPCVGPVIPGNAPRCLVHANSRRYGMPPRATGKAVASSGPMRASAETGRQVVALMDSVNAATIAARPTFSQQCRDVPPPIHEAFPYRQPRSNPYRHRHRCFAAAACPAATAVPIRVAKAGGAHRKRKQDAAGSRTEPSTSGKKNRAGAIRGAGSAAETTSCEAASGQAKT